MSFNRSQRRSIRHSTGLFLLAACLFVSGLVARTHKQSAHSDDQPKKITANVNLVLLPVSITDSNGGFITGLKQDDFRVYEDGQLQKLGVFEQQDTPVTVGLVVDHSRSMRSKLGDVITAVATFARASNPQDEMFVVDFNDDVTVEIMKGKAFSNDPNELREALTAVAARGRTALYDAVTEGLHHLQYAHREKKALILISDGGDNASHIKYSQVLAQARQSQALIYSIALVGYEQDEENPDVLRKLCKNTGGIAYFPQKGQSVTEVASQIARDLRAQYTLGYVPESSKHADAFRKIEVKVAAPNRGKFKVRTRPGYTPGPQALSANASAASESK